MKRGRHEEPLPSFAARPEEEPTAKCQAIGWQRTPPASCHPAAGPTTATTPQHTAGRPTTGALLPEPQSDTFPGRGVRLPPSQGSQPFAPHPDPRLTPQLPPLPCSTNWLAGAAAWRPAGQAAAAPGNPHGTQRRTAPLRTQELPSQRSSRGSLFRRSGQSPRAGYQVPRWPGSTMVPAVRLGAPGAPVPVLHTHVGGVSTVAARDAAAHSQAANIFQPLQPAGNVFATAGQQPQVVVPVPHSAEPGPCGACGAAQPPGLPPSYLAAGATATSPRPGQLSGPAAPACGPCPRSAPMWVTPAEPQGGEAGVGPSAAQHAPAPGGGIFAPLPPGSQRVPAVSAGSATSGLSRCAAGGAPAMGSYAGTSLAVGPASKAASQGWRGRSLFAPQPCSSRAPLAASPGLAAGTAARAPSQGSGPAARPSEAAGWQRAAQHTPSAPLPAEPPAEPPSTAGPAGVAPCAMDSPARAAAAAPSVSPLPPAALDAASSQPRPPSPPAEPAGGAAACAGASPGPASAPPPAPPKAVLSLPSGAALKVGPARPEGRVAGRRTPLGMARAWQLGQRPAGQWGEAVVALSHAPAAHRPPPPPSPQRPLRTALRDWLPHAGVAAAFEAKGVRSLYPWWGGVGGGGGGVAHCGGRGGAGSLLRGR
jgi:hypothetical protein